MSKEGLELNLGASPSKEQEEGVGEGTQRLEEWLVKPGEGGQEGGVCPFSGQLGSFCRDGGGEQLGRGNEWER